MHQNIALVPNFSDKALNFKAIKTIEVIKIN